MILNHIIVKTINFKNNLALESQNIHLNMNLNTSFELSDDEESGICKQKLTIKSDRDEFDFFIEMHGFFDLKDENDVNERIDELGNEADHLTYPQLSAYVTTIFTLSGLSPLYLPMALIEKEN